MAAPAPLPKTPLGYHRILSPSAGVRVSPLCLGGMNFGDAWQSFMGSCNKETTFKILDYYYESGGNFIDTANNYQAEESEMWIGEWMERRGVRNEIVLATKYTTGYIGANAGAVQSNYAGNNTKSLHVSVEASLKKLRTSYIDILYLHWWDFTTSVPEIMTSLNSLADRGKVLYLGISDTPAWLVSKANQYARDHGLRPFVVYQGRWSAALRDFERDIIPMCEAEGMGIAPWGVLGGGHFKTEEQMRKEEGRKAFMPATDAEMAVSKVLERIAKGKGRVMTSIAYVSPPSLFTRTTSTLEPERANLDVSLAYCMQKTPNVFPIVGGRKVEQLQGNIAALSIKLSAQEIEAIEEAYPFDYGFPLNFLFIGQKQPSRYGNDVLLTKMSAHLDVVQRPRAIEPREEV
ncbi:hypothetical protein LTR48_000365 [Friedmanniomyces endolithicus]|uniref:NADP-dependent oxidoreductase domain-containing protein n=1 Tax=Rachicladosporium monterosium TaxID=1507873 RepID=A0ABR0LGU1_9PEZI|nr:hypothetical protein LTR48_000365 [Friedmanniomyces endolithicus]KAK5148562.1 hypothetical protein LTR32_000159 [Rachicladosporium monterosium]